MIHLQRCTREQMWKECRDLMFTHSGGLQHSDGSSANDRYGRAADSEGPCDSPTATVLFLRAREMLVAQMGLMGRGGRLGIEMGVSVGGRSIGRLPIGAGVKVGGRLGTVTGVSVGGRLGIETGVRVGGRLGMETGVRVGGKLGTPGTGARVGRTGVAVVVVSTQQNVSPCISCCICDDADHCDNERNTRMQRKGCR